MKKDTGNKVTDTLQWGLKCGITPHFSARLVQEGCRLHFLTDRASITGVFSEADLRHLDFSAVVEATGTDARDR